jgi:hypothetical protein
LVADPTITAQSDGLRNELNASTSFELDRSGKPHDDDNQESGDPRL